MGEAVNNTAGKHQKKSRWKGIKKEFSKISWPSKESLMKQSVAVIIITVIIGVVITLVDFIIKSGMGLFI
jgi:preprotein translocase subunit SecE